MAVDLARDSHRSSSPDLRGLGLSAVARRRLRQEKLRPRRRGRAQQAQASTAPTSSPTTSAIWSPMRSHAQYPERVLKLVVIDAPLPRRRPFRRRSLKNPLLVALPLRRPRHGAPRRPPRAHLALDRFRNEFSATPARFSEAAREHHAMRSYAMPGAPHSGFAQFAAFDQDAIDNHRRSWPGAGRLKCPCWPLAAEVFRTHDGHRDARRGR